MEILPTVRKWLSSVSSQSYDSVSQQTPDSLLEKARKGSFPSDSPEEKSVMASIPSKEYVPPTPVRPFSEEISAAVREQYQKFQQPKEVVRFLSELAIDPTTYIPASKGIGITAAGLGILTGLLKAGTIVRSPSRLMPNLKSQIGAFRPSGSVISPLALKDAKADIQKAKDWTARDNSPDVLLASKISDRELQRYGTPEFLLDSRLTSTQDELFERVSVRPKTANDPARADYLQRRWTSKFDDERLNLEEDRKYLRGTMENKSYSRDVRQEFGPDYISHLPMYIDDIGYASGKVIKRVDELARIRKDLISHVRAKSDAVTAGKAFYIADNQFVNRDIGEAVRKYADDLEDSPLSPDQLSKKSLQQLLMHADDIAKVKAELLRKEEESLKSLPEFTKARTATLQAEQGLPGGFVELKQPADFGAETEFLNHCVGAGGYNGDTKKYLFQHHPISGREVIKNKGSSYSDYKKALDSGESRFFSYRPEGVPELTVEVGIKNKAIRQVYGKNDRLPTKEERQKVQDFVDAELGGKHRFTSLDLHGPGDWIPE